jgi:hypothetical protein
MSSHNLEIDYGSFLHKEKLKSDRSNFPDWYQRLRDILNGNDLLYIIQESLGEAPKYMMQMLMITMSIVIIMTKP